jgi:hypothetical protein
MAVLAGARVWFFCNTSSIRKLRPPLSHTVYIELILFGGMQICLTLPAAKQGAILGFLDPITGEESFGELKPLYILYLPCLTFGLKPKRRIHATYILQRLSDEANARGVARPPNLSVLGYDLGPPNAT